MEKEPLVSVICCTYNQKNFIAQCLDGFVMQKTNFPFVAIVADDCSTDGTRDIVKEYAEKYPDIIKPVLRDKNLGPNYCGLDAITYCNSKYMAICDGDDYWTDPYKLQKQVDFLESHPDYSICFGKMKMIYENCKKHSKILPLKMDKNPQSFVKLLKGGYIPTNSVMYRFEYLKKALENYPDGIYPQDWYYHIMVAKCGKIGFINEVMSVYRRNEGGISYTTSENHGNGLHQKYGLNELKFFHYIWQQVKDIYPQYYEEMFLPNLRDVYFTYLKASDFEKLNIIKDNYSQYFKDMESGSGLIFYKHKRYKKMFTVSLIINIVLAVLMLCTVVLFFIK